MQLEDLPDDWACPSCGQCKDELRERNDGAFFHLPPGSLSADTLAEMWRTRLQVGTAGCSV